MNVTDNHDESKPVSVFPIFKGETGNAVTIRILQNERLKEHITTTPALLICISGQVVFEDVNGTRQTLNNGDYISIQPMVKHWVEGIETSYLILLK